MNTHRITDPIVDHLPVAGTTALVATVTDAASELAGQVADLDLGDAVRRSRRTVARYVPWMSPGRRPRSLRRWIVVGAVLTALALAGAMVARRRTAGRTTGREAWSTTQQEPTSNGDHAGHSPSGVEVAPDRSTVTADA